jgi:hypothetical protein
MLRETKLCNRKQRMATSWRGPYVFRRETTAEVAGAVKGFRRKRQSHTLCALRQSKEEVTMRYFVAALALVFALGLGHVAFAADGWDTQNNGYGQYHVSNG